ncbi:elongation factor P [candidate division WS5 bacterium]|uniref:Elongation factor P n=1 Tax=candidate division WS5 bacterium TaxID=2093353 RepID=A0A419DET3_9BACT|nr:MAG: elongation factor P [candidate division WS5 bacterium]
MYDISDLKVGTVFEYEKEPYVVVESQHTKLGRGGAILRAKIKNIITGAALNKTFKSSDKFNPVNIERKKAQFLYCEGSSFLFMDQGTFEQMPLDTSFVGDASKYLLEGSVYQLQIYKGNPITIDLPIKMEFRVTEAEKGLKGDTASSATKPVRIETGLKVNVPLFIKKGDRIRVDTRDGSYVERAK